MTRQLTAKKKRNFVFFMLPLRPSRRFLEFVTCDGKEKYGQKSLRRRWWVRRLRGGDGGEGKNSFTRGSRFYMNMTEVIVVPFQGKGEGVGRKLCIGTA